jgi:DNA-binding NtrC family response regulator
VSSVRVLIVDDESEYIEVLSERLSLRGYETMGASGGEEALRLIGEQPVDIVLLDVMMPGLGGIDTLIRIKNHDPGIAVIMLSGHADVKTAIQGMELGAYDYLVKPVTLDELLYKIEDARSANVEG